MPAPGDQHNGRAIANPFEEVKPRMSEFTAQEIATLQSRLEKQLGPEYISSRAGPSGQKVHYITAEKCIQLANEVFGFNGWSSQIMETQVDFVDENATTFKVSLGLSVIVRVTLRDGTFHEDVGYGHIENCKGKAAAFEKAKKEGTTDGLKRALRNFGNVLGNCIYDKDYLTKVTKIRIQPAKWDVNNLHRHSTYASPEVPTKVVEVAKVPEKPEAPRKVVEIVKVSEKPQTMGPPSIATDESMDDEFGDFDDADFNVDDSNIHPDEVVLPAPPQASHHFNNARNSNPAQSTNGATPNQIRPQGAPIPPITRPQSLHQPNRPPEAGGPTPRINPPAPQPRTPTAGLARSASGASGPNPPARPPQTLNQPNRPIASVPGRILNQPNRPQPTSAPPSPSHPSSDDLGDEMPPAGAGFFSARAAALLPSDPVPDGQQPPSLVNLNLPAFNPNAESPSIRRTPGVDQKSSKPLARDLKAVVHSSQAGGGGAAGGRPGNIVNPQLDGARKIGAPGGGGFSSPGGRGTAFRAPSIKRPIGDVNANMNNRTPLTDLQTNGPVGEGMGMGQDAKRQRLNG